MIGKLESLWRYPVKGFTPERMTAVRLDAGAYFPCDRLYAVEDGPSGFDPAAPAWVSKQRFTVLAKTAQVARVRTAYDEGSSVLTARAFGQPDFRGALTAPEGRDEFAVWLASFLGNEANGPLKVVHSTGHRFTDDPTGYVSVVNLASVRDLEAKAGRVIDPLRFRANLYVDGWPAWEENQVINHKARIGGALARVTSPIVRCAATHVDPSSGERDFDLVRALFEYFGHRYCGVYVAVEAEGLVTEGDPIELVET